MNSIGGKIPTLVNKNYKIRNKDIDINEYLNYLLPLLYNYNKQNIVNNNQLIYSSENNTYYEYDKNFTLFQKSKINKKCVVDEKFLESHWIFKIFKINIFESENIMEQKLLNVPIYYGYLQRFKILETIHDIININTKYNKIGQYQLKLLESLFIFNKNTKIFININVKNNIIDKYIFINKFNLFLKMILFRDNKSNFFNKKTSTKKDLLSIFENKNKTIFEKAKFLINDYKKNKELLYCTNLSTNNEYNIIFNKIVHIDQILKSIYEIINLNNLIDIYEMLTAVYDYNGVKNNETSTKNIIKKVKKINCTKDYDHFYEEIYNLFEFSTILESFNNYLGLGVNLDSILVLIYYKIRSIDFKVIEVHKMNALPVNSYISFNSLNYTTRNILPNEESLVQKLILNNSFPVFFNYCQINIESGISFSNCVENSILQLVKLLFWNFENKQYDINNINFFKDNVFTKFVKEYNVFTLENNYSVNYNFALLISKLPDIQYIKNNMYEVKSEINNIIKIVYYLLGTSEHQESATNIFDMIEKINKNINKENYDFRFIEPNILELNMDNYIIKLFSEDGHCYLEAKNDDNLEFNFYEHVDTFLFKVVNIYSKSESIIKSLQLTPLYNLLTIRDNKIVSLIDNLEIFYYFINTNNILNYEKHILLLINNSNDKKELVISLIDYLQSFYKIEISSIENNKIIIFLVFIISRIIQHINHEHKLSITRNKLNKILFKTLKCFLYNKDIDDIKINNFYLLNYYIYYNRTYTTFDFVNLLATEKAINVDISQSPLFYYITNKEINIDILKKIVSPENINFTHRLKGTPVSSYLRYRNSSEFVDINVIKLLRSDVNINIIDRRGESPLLSYLLMDGNNEEIVKELVSDYVLNYNYNINSKVQSILSYYCAKQDINKNILKLLIIPEKLEGDDYNEIPKLIYISNHRPLDFEIIEILKSQKEIEEERKRETERKI